MIAAAPVCSLIARCEPASQLRGRLVLVLLFVRWVEAVRQLAVENETSVSRNFARNARSLMSFIGS